MMPSKKLTSPPFVAYIRAVSGGACLTKTSHDAVLDGHPLDGLVAGAGGALDKWRALCAAVGPAEAKAQVAAWIEHPWSLRGLPST